MDKPADGLTSSPVKPKCRPYKPPPAVTLPESNSRNHLQPAFTTMSSRNTSDFGLNVICAAGIPRDPAIVRHAGTHKTQQLTSRPIYRKAILAQPIVLARSQKCPSFAENGPRMDGILVVGVGGGKGLMEAEKEGRIRGRVI
jgi:hypothetical protein